MREQVKQITDELPEIIGYRTSKLAPLLKKWRKNNPDVPWGKLLTSALRIHLKPLAGKRDQHLVAETNFFLGRSGRSFTHEKK